VLPVILAALAASAPGTRGEKDRVDRTIAELIGHFRGEMGVAAINLATHEVIAINADTRFPTASTIKTGVMLEAYHRAAAGDLPLGSTLTLHDAAKVGGSGVLRGLHDGLALSVEDLIYLMIAVSDNTATNMLIARLGTARINERLESYGLHETRLFRPTFRDGRADVQPELEREFGLGMTTPREMATLMTAIADGKAVSMEASYAMLAMLRKQTDRAMIPRLLPGDGPVIGNKTGTDEEKLAGPHGRRGHIRADAGIVTGPGLRYAVAIYARRVEDTRWTPDNDALTTGARVSRIIYDHFATPK
jgi:beta-lactamase class A